MSPLPRWLADDAGEKRMQDAALASLAGTVEALWNEKCAGNRNPERCESCRAYQDTLAAIADARAAAGGPWVVLATDHDRVVNGLRARIDATLELLHRQRILHTQLISPTHPHSPPLIEVDRVIAVLNAVPR